MVHYSTLWYIVVYSQNYPDGISHRAPRVWGIWIYGFGFLQIVGGPGTPSFDADNCKWNIAVLKTGLILRNAHMTARAVKHAVECNHL